MLGFHHSVSPIRSCPSVYDIFTFLTHRRCVKAPEGLKYTSACSSWPSASNDAGLVAGLSGDCRGNGVAVFARVVQGTCTARREMATALLIYRKFHARMVAIDPQCIKVWATADKNSPCGRRYSPIFRARNEPKVDGDAHTFCCRTRTRNSLNNDLRIWLKYVVFEEEICATRVELIIRGSVCTFRARN